MNTTEMKNADALNSIYLTCDESGDVSIWGGRPDVERSTMNGDMMIGHNVIYPTEIIIGLLKTYAVKTPCVDITLEGLE